MGAALLVRRRAPVLFDMPLAELQRYRPDVTEPSDFVEFWRSEVDDARTHPIDAAFVPASTHLRHAEVFDVEFSGHGGDRIRGWFVHSKGRRAPTGHGRRVCGLRRRTRTSVRLADLQLSRATRIW
jgi:hypothetical protein